MKPPSTAGCMAYFCLSKNDYFIDGVVEKQPTAAEVNISGGKDQDKKEESQRTEQRLSKNQTGKRTEEEVVEVVA